MTRPLRIAIGTDNFRFIREDHAYYVDKTAMIHELVVHPRRSMLITRPRRFGKSLNLSMLRYFFEPSEDDLSWMFEELAVWKSEEARAHFQRHPVIFLNFKDAKAQSWDLVWQLIRSEISNAFAQHAYLASSAKLARRDREKFDRIYQEEADEALYHEALPLLSRLLHAHHGEPVVLLIDEYDAPIHAGITGGFAEPVITFFRNFLGGGLKSNEHLYRGVLTGVLRIAKESIFSELNNLDVFSVLAPEFADCCGFTQAEVDQLAQDADLPDGGKALAEWYNGYHFGEHVIYNPWSVLNYVDKPARGLTAYWVASGGDDVLRSLVLDKGFDLLDDMQTLLRGGTISKEVTEHVALRQLEGSATAMWSLLVMSGYLTVANKRVKGRKFEAELVIPNLEVREAFEEGVMSWIASAEPSSDKFVPTLQRAMLEGDEEVFGELLQDVVLATLSSRDLAKGPSAPPERVFQAFVLGMLVSMQQQYEVRSEEESGYGRCDVLVRPKTPGKPGAVLEMKRPRAATQQAVDTALDQALEQIEKRNYVQRLQQAGAEPIVRWGVVFDGKRVWVRRG